MSRYPDNMSVTGSDGSDAPSSEEDVLELQESEVEAPAMSDEEEMAAELDDGFHAFDDEPPPFPVQVDEDGVVTGVSGIGADHEEAGVGPGMLSVERAKALLAEKHNMAVAPDDPMLMVVTLHQAFLGDLERALHTNRLAIERVLEDNRQSLEGMRKETVTALSEGIADALERFRKETFESHFSSTLAKVAEDARRSEAQAIRIEQSLKRSVRAHYWLTLATWLGAALALASAFWIGLR